MVNPMLVSLSNEIHRLKERNAEVIAERDAKDAACGRWHRALVKVRAERDRFECLLREIADSIDADLGEGK